MKGSDVQPETSATPTSASESESAPSASGWRQAQRVQLKGRSFEQASLMLKPDSEGGHDEHDHGGHDHMCAPVMIDGQTNQPSTARPTVPVAVTGEVTIDSTGSDPCNQALVLMASGSEIERNTATRVNNGTHKVAYLEDIATDPDSDDLLDSWGYDKASFTVKLDPWTGNRMIVQNNAVGFAIGSNLVGSRGATVARWRTLLCHEVNHLVNDDNSSAGDSFRRYVGEFRAYWLAEYAHMEDLDARADAIKAHVLRDYPLIKNKYDTNEEFKERIDAHRRPSDSDNLVNSIEEGGGGSWV